MEEKKKRWRPSLTAYRELEEVIHRQCQELDAWRKKYRELNASVDCYRSEIDSLRSTPVGVRMESELKRLRESNDMLDRSNRQMEDRIAKMTGDITLLEEAVREKAMEVDELRSRGFWKRLFNK